MDAQTALLSSLTIPGRPEHLRSARSFVARYLGDDYPCTDTVVLLTSELVSNSMQHSSSRRPGGSITIALMAIPGGVRVEVTDEGSATVPAIQRAARAPDLAESGRGLEIVDMLSTSWSYRADEQGTVTWFELADLTP
jgi:anti-sigma regulatory factor (Ser/Thr protein kinase)